MRMKNSPNETMKYLKRIWGAAKETINWGVDESNDNHYQRTTKNTDSDITVYNTVESEAGRQAMVEDLDAIPKADLEELVGEWGQRTEEFMGDVDTTASHYTGNAGSLSLGMKVAAQELQEVIDKHD